jgi:hypothetical protein
MTASVSLIEALGGDGTAPSCPHRHRSPRSLLRRRPPSRNKRGRHCGDRKPAGKCQRRSPCCRNGCVQRRKPQGNAPG